jgi:hypothetical protein
MRRSRAALVVFLGTLGLALQLLTGLPSQSGAAADLGAGTAVACDGFTLASCGTGTACGFVLGFHADGLARARGAAEGNSEACEAAALRPAWRYWYEHPLCCAEAAGASRVAEGKSLAALAADPRHSSGNEEALRLNDANDGLNDPVVVWPVPRAAQAAMAPAARVQGPPLPSWAYGCDVDYFLYPRAAAAPDVSQPGPARSAKSAQAAPRPPVVRSARQLLADDWMRHEYECQFGCDADDYEPRYTSRPATPAPAAPAADLCHPGDEDLPCAEGDWLASEQFSSADQRAAEEIVREDILATEQSAYSARRNLSHAALALRCLGDLLTAVAAEVGRLADAPQAARPADDFPVEEPQEAASVPFPDAYLGL